MSDNAALTNTIETNRHRQQFADGDDIWVFGYGSLIFKADFDFLERRPASIRHWSRRFWQGSHDHRGTPDHPGRVVTLIEERNSLCLGMAYRITPQVVDHLDFREKNGYLRFVTEMLFDAPDSAPGIVYIATPENEAYLGPAEDREIAEHIANSAGPSGSNREYALCLAESLEKLNARDPHVETIAGLLKHDFVWKQPDNSTKAVSEQDR